ncbi:MAG: glycosyltransferase family 2 protein [Planctomycetota bacterium]
MTSAAIIACCLCLFFAIHPFVTYPLTLWVVGRVLVRKSAVTANSTSPSISICLCAYNEEDVIGEKLANLEQAADAYAGSVEVLLFTDGCSDRTAELARESESRVRVVESHERSGKSAGMNQLMEIATGEVTVFTDANVLLQADTLQHLVKGFSDDDVGCVCGVLHYTNGDECDVAAVGTLYWRLEEFIKKWESITGSTMGADGALFAIRRSLYTPVPSMIIDDMFTSMNILISGYKVKNERSAVAFEKNATKTSDEFQRKIRIACRSFNCHRLLYKRVLGFKPWDLYKYLSHKLMRWLVVYWLAFAAVFALIASARSGVLPHFLTASCAVLFCLMMGRAGVPKLRKPWEIWLAFLAVGIGVFHSIQGRTYQTWIPPQSARS